MRNGFARFISKKRERKYLNSYYNSIHNLPIGKWFDIHRTNDLNYLSKGKNIPPNILAKVWTVIYDEYIKEFGLGETMKDVVEKEKEIAALRVERIVNDDDSLETFIEIAEIQLVNLKKSFEGKANFLESKVMLDKAMGFQVDTVNTTVAQYYSYFAILAKQKRE